MRYMRAAGLRSGAVADGGVGAGGGRHNQDRHAGRSGPVGPGLGRHAGRALHFRGDVRQAGRPGAGSALRAAACHEMGVVAGQPGADVHAARGRHLPGRRADDGGVRARQPGSLPHHAGERAQGRIEIGIRGGGGRSAHGAPGAVAALRAADCRAVGSRRHDGFDEGRRQDGQGLLHPSGLLGPVQASSSAWRRTTLRWTAIPATGMRRRFISIR